MLLIFDDFFSDLPRLEVALSALPSLKLISDSICKLPSEKIQLRLFSVKNVSSERQKMNSFDIFCFSTI